MRRSESSRFSRDETGFTRSEVLVVLTLVGTLTAALGSVVVSSQKGYEEVTHSAVSDAALRRVLDRITSDLREAYPYSLRITDSAAVRTLSYVTVQGFGDASPVLGPRQSVEFREGKVSLNGTTLASGIDDMTFRYEGGLLSISLRVQRGDISRQLSTTTRI